MALSSALAGSVGAVPIGTVNAFAGSTAPSGWMLCYGQAIDRVQYSGLYLVIGTLYGAGDGTTTFNLPDLRGRVPAGLDNMGGSAASRLTSGTSGITATTLGAVGGNEAMHLHQHANTATFTGTAGNTGTQSANHTHGTGNGYSWIVSNRTAGAANGSSSAALTDYLNATGTESANHTHAFTPAGTVSMSNANFGSGSSQNVQPTIVLNYIIKAQ